MNKLKRKNKNSLLVRLVIKPLILILFIGCILIPVLYIFQMKEIRIEGTERYTSEDMKSRMITTQWESNTIYLYFKYKYFEEMTLPFIQKFDVTMVDNNTLNIQFYEKRITGSVEFLGEYLYFDKDGIIVESSSTKLPEIPQVKGLKFNKVVLNEKLEVQKDELFEVILNLAKLIEYHQLDIHTIHFSNANEVTVESGNIKVQLGKQSTYDDVLMELKGILKEIKGESYSIDLRDYVKGKNKIYAKPK